MIKIFRNDKDVCLDFTLKVPTHTLVWDYHFTWHCADAVAAGFITHAMDKQLGDRLAAIREEAYEQGWKDAKAKRHKNTWFSRRLG